MIINSVCSTCLQPFKILVQTSDLELVKQVSTNEGRTCPCPRLCGGEINLVGEPQLLDGIRLRDPMELTGLQLFQAIGGLGLADEIPKDGTVIDALFKAYRIVSVQIEEIGGLCYLHELRLEGGVIVHLSSGARGARVLKITKEAQNVVSNPG